MLHDDKGRGFLAALGHTQEGTHPQFGCILLVQDLAAQGIKVTGYLQRQLGQIGGRGIVRRPVDQIAGQAGCLGDNLTQLSSLFHIGHLGFVKLHQRELLRVSPIRSLILQLLIAVQPQNSTLYHGLGSLRHLKTSRSSAMDNTAEGLGS